MPTDNANDRELKASTLGRIPNAKQPKEARRPSSPTVPPERAASRSPISGSAADLEATAKAALLRGSKPSEKSSEERVNEAKEKVEADAARLKALASGHGSDPRE